MKFLISGLGRYLIRETLIGIAIAFGAVLVTILLVDLVEQFRSTGLRVELSLAAALRLTMLRVPMMIEQTMPFIVLAGVMIATIRLNRTSQLVALRASGVSAWRFLAPGALCAAIMGVLIVTALNPLGAHLYARYEGERARLESESRQVSLRNGLWIRQGDQAGQVVIHADAVETNGTRLTNATFMFFEEQHGTLRFSRRIRAETADLRPGFWQLTNLVEGAAGERPIPQEHLAIPTSLHPSELLDRFAKPETLSFWDLPGFIAQANAAGLAPVRYDIRWQTLLAYPLMLAAMAALGSVFTLRLQRLGQVAEWGAVGVAFGLSLFFMSRLAAAFAAAQAVPPFVAAWSAPLTGVFTALAIVAFMEDG
ncbi:MAG: LptF/LptG family permease [Hyphomonadaceae bacterium]